MSLYALLALMDGSGRTAKRTRVLVVLVAVVVVVLALIPSGADARENTVAREPAPMALRSTDDGWADFSSGADDITQPESGIGPGTRLRITFPDGSALGCTANFLWRDQNDVLYLGTAGHCLVPEGKTATHGPLADYSPAGITVDAMTPGCLGDPGLRIEPAGVVCDHWKPIGVPVYATSRVVGRDFGLIQLSPDVRPLLRAAMPRWDGPYSVGVLNPGTPTFQYGHGIVAGSWFVSRSRTGVGLLTEDTIVGIYNSFAYAGLSAPGDSGSAVNGGVSAPDGQVRSQSAIGVLTHSLPGTVYGTPVARAQELARDAELDVDVVTVGEAL